MDIAIQFGKRFHPVRFNRLPKGTVKEGKEKVSIND